MRLSSPSCVAFGMGAIGRAVSGYAMTTAGIHVTFADIAVDQIQAVNRDGGYWLATADIYSKETSETFISNVDAMHVESPHLCQRFAEAEYMVCAVGSKGFRALLPRILSLLKERDSLSNDPLYCLIFENDHAAMTILLDAVQETFGSCPPWFHISKCSIERMAKVSTRLNGSSMVIGETFFPIIADCHAMEGCSIYDRADVLELVDDVEMYYFRKLLTNNLGHAVLAYAGTPKGYKTTLEAMSDPDIFALLQKTLAESGRAVCDHWGFSQSHMTSHLETLMLRYSNPGLIDELSRLGRDPIRKLGAEERISYPLRLCYQYQIRPEGLLETLCYAINFEDPSQELNQLRKSIGYDGILRTICGATDAFLFNALQNINQHTGG